MPTADPNLRTRFLRAMAPESQFYLLFEHMPGVSFFAKDRQFRFVCANRHFYERFGCTAEDDIVGKDSSASAVSHLDRSKPRAKQGVATSFAGRVRASCTPLAPSRRVQGKGVSRATCLRNSSHWILKALS
jgi:hypothetical protein